MINERMFDSSKEKCYCDQVNLIENYNEAISDLYNVWECHHKLEAFFTMDELIEMNRYYKVEPRELIFLKCKEHDNWPHIGRVIKDSTKQKMSDSHKGKSSGMKGKIPWNKGKKGVQKMSEETKEKQRKSQIGRHWYTNGVTSIKCYECPPGYKPGRTRNW